MKQTFKSLTSFKFLIIYCLLFVTLSILSCDDKPKVDETTVSNIDTSIKEPEILATPLTGYLHELTMDKADYKILRDANSGNNAKMVFQFYFADTIANGPTLVAYSSGKGLKGNKYGPNVDPPTGRIFTFLKVTTLRSLDLSAAPNRKFALGDQQILFKKLEDEYGLDTKPESADFVLRFIPQLTGININYSICLVGGACPHPAPLTQPSPPANTN